MSILTTGFDLLSQLDNLKLKILQFKWHFLMFLTKIIDAYINLHQLLIYI